MFTPVYLITIVRLSALYLWGDPRTTRLGLKRGDEQELWQ